MFGTIRKHQTWLWVIIIAIISVSMVAFFSDGSSLFDSNNRGGGELGYIGTRAITTTEYLASLAELKTDYLLKTGQMPPSDENTQRTVEQQTIVRVFLDHKLKEMGIEPSEKAVAMLMHEQIREIPLERIESEFLQPHGLTKEDYLRYVRKEAGIQQLRAAAASGARLVTPGQAEELFRRDHQELAVELASFWATNFLDKVVITNGAIGAYYTNWLGQYLIPERTILSFVEFNASNYLAKADEQIARQYTNLNALIDEDYIKRGGTNFFKDTNGVPMTEIEAKTKVKEDVRLGFGLQEARRAAADFGNALFDAKPDANKIENLAKIAAEKSLIVKVTKPFDRTTGLEEFPDSDLSTGRAEEREAFHDVVRREADKLTTERPIRFNPIPGLHSVYVIAKKGTVARELQPLEKVSEKVTNDFRKFVSQQLARTAGQTFHTNLTNALAQGKAFDAVCATEKVPVIKVPPFSLATQTITNLDARINQNLLKNIASDMKVGDTSPFLPFSQEGGLILHLKDRPKLNDTGVKEGLSTYLTNIRQARYNEAFNAWLRKAVEQAHLQFPQRDTAINAQPQKK